MWLERRIASSRSAKRYSDVTGPNTSSWERKASSSTSSNSAGVDHVAVVADPLPAEHARTALCLALLDGSENLVQLALG